MGRTLRLLCIAFICSCCATAPQPAPFGAIRFEPEPWYRLLYDNAKACVIAAGRTPREGSEYEPIIWLEVAHKRAPGWVGLWSWPNRIYLDEQYVMHPYVVRHELTHHLLGGGFLDDAHQDPVFKACTEAPYP